MDFTSTDVERIRSEGFVREIEVHSEIGSTNDRAAQRAEERALPCPCLILAERQNAGRGRGANTWWSGSGALTFSLVLEPRRIGLLTESFPQVALVAGLAVGEAIERTLPQSVVGLKWPNDVFLDGKKVCGILLEAPNVESGRLIAGIGVNVNNSLALAPAELRRTAVSMIDVAGQPLDRTQIHDELLCTSLEGILNGVAKSDSPFAQYNPAADFKNCDAFHVTDVNLRAHCNPP